MKSLLRKRTVVYLQIALAAGLAAAMLFVVRFGPLERAERFVLERFYEWRGPLTPSPDVVIVGIDDASLEAFGGWPWPRTTLIDLIDRLGSLGAGAIGLDLTFAEDLMGSDRAILERIQERRDVVIGYQFYRDREDIPLDVRAWATGEDSFDMLTSQMIASTVMPDGVLPSMAGVASLPRGLRLRGGLLGFTNLLPPRDRVLLDVPLVVRYRNLLVPSIALATVARYQNFTPLVRLDSHGMLRGAVVGEMRVPLKPDGRMVFNAMGPAGTYAHIGVSDIIAGQVEPERLSGKIVLVGPLFSGPTPRFATPFSDDIPSVEIWANAIDTMLTGRTISCLAYSRLVTVAIILVLAVLMGLILPRVRLAYSLGIALIVALAVVIDGYIFFSRAGMWFAVATPLIAIVCITAAITVFRMGTEERARRRLTLRFGRSLGAKSIERLATDPASLIMEGNRRHLSVAAVNVRRFDDLCAEMKPEHLLSFMRSFMREIESHLFAHDAFVEYRGNAGMLAVFGAPVGRADHAQQTCAAALEVRKTVAQKAPGWKERYRIGSLKLCIGLHAGPLVTGGIDSISVPGFAAMGNTISVADLLAHASRVYRTPLVASAEIVQSAREHFTFRPLDVIRTKSMRRPLEIFELMGTRGVVTPYIEVYLRAYEAYRARRFDDAIRFADEVLAKTPHDGPTRLLKERSERLKTNPPPEDWNGVWQP